MKISRISRPAIALAVASAAVIALSSCASNEGGGSATGLSGTLAGAGASTQESAQKAWTAAFQTENTQATVNYTVVGSGAGREKFIAGGTNFAATDSYLSDEELAGTFAACAAGSTPFEVPVYISPIAVIYNVEGVTDLKLDAKTLAGIFSGAITKWNDPAITALNAGTTFPDLAITAVHRSDDSGTTKNFSDYLFQNAPDVWAIDKPSDAFPFKSGDGSKGTSGVVGSVTDGVGTIGYADASKAADLGIAQIKVGTEYVGPTAAGAAAVVAESSAVEGRSASDMAVKLNRTTTNSAEYPLVLVSYIVGCNEYTDANIAALVKGYVGYIVSDAGQQAAAAAAGSAPLDATMAKQAADIIAAIK